MNNTILYYLTPLFKVILFAFFIFLCVIPFGLIAQLKLISLAKDSVWSDILLESASVLVVLGALLMIFQTYRTIDFQQVFIEKRNAFSGFLKGSLIGLILILLCGGLLLINGNVTFNISTISYIAFLSYFVYFIIVALFEELFFRTFALFVFAERYPLILTLVINGILFGLVHLANPGFTWLSMVNITLAGILFSIYTLLKRNLSWAIGIHFGWNFTQGILLGYKVSGTNTPGVLSATPIGSPYLSGGIFGIEGSIFCTIILIALISYLLIRNKFEPIKGIVFEKEINTI